MGVGGTARRSAKCVHSTLSDAWNGGQRAKVARAVGVRAILNTRKLLEESKKQIENLRRQSKQHRENKAKAGQGTAPTTPVEHCAAADPVGDAEIVGIDKPAVDPLLRTTRDTDALLASVGSVQKAEAVPRTPRMGPATPKDGSRPGSMHRRTRSSFGGGSAGVGSGAGGGVVRRRQCVSQEPISRRASTGVGGHLVTTPKARVKASTPSKLVAAGNVAGAVNAGASGCGTIDGTAGNFGGSGILSGGSLSRNGTKEDPPVNDAIVAHSKGHNGSAVLAESGSVPLQGGNSGTAGCSRGGGAGSIVSGEGSIVSTGGSGAGGGSISNVSSGSSGGCAAMGMGLGVCVGINVGISVGGGPMMGAQQMQGTSPTMMGTPVSMLQTPLVQQQQLAPSSCGPEHAGQLQLATDEAHVQKEIERRELCKMFDSLDLKTDGSGGVCAVLANGSTLSPEEIMRKFQAILQECRYKQRSLEDAQAKVSKLEQANMDLVMENYKLRTQPLGTPVSQAQQQQPLPQHAQPLAQPVPAVPPTWASPQPQQMASTSSAASVAQCGTGELASGVSAARVRISPSATSRHVDAFMTSSRQVEMSASSPTMWAARSPTPVSARPVTGVARSGPPSIKASVVVMDGNAARRGSSVDPGTPSIVRHMTPTRYRVETYANAPVGSPVACRGAVGMPPASSAAPVVYQGAPVLVSAVAAPSAFGRPVTTIGHGYPVH